MLRLTCFSKFNFETFVWAIVFFTFFFHLPQIWLVPGQWFSHKIVEEFQSWYLFRVSLIGEWKVLVKLFIAELWVKGIWYEKRKKKHVFCNLKMKIIIIKKTEKNAYVLHKLKIQVSSQRIAWWSKLPSVAPLHLSFTCSNMWSSWEGQWRKYLSGFLLRECRWLRWLFSVL